MLFFWVSQRSSKQSVDEWKVKFPVSNTFSAKKMNKKINLIVAAAQNMGIGYKGGIPWVLR